MNKNKITPLREEDLATIFQGDYPTNKQILEHLSDEVLRKHKNYLDDNYNSLDDSLENIRVDIIEVLESRRVNSRR
jgi:hypothetical protein